MYTYTVKFCSFQFLRLTAKETVDVTPPPLQKYNAWKLDGFPQSPNSVATPQPKSLKTQKKPEKPRKSSYCRIHDFSRKLNVSDNSLFECVKTTAASNLSICLYPSESDVWISKPIRKKGAFEPQLSRIIMSALDSFPKAAFLDIGANIGVHSLVAARRGRRVFSVEPNFETVKRFHKSVNLNGLQDKCTLINNGVSDVRENLTLLLDETNRGRSSIVFNAGKTTQTIETILFDDLLEVVNVPEVVIKIDVEAAEARAFKISKEFFAQVKVNVIFMEWQCFKVYHILQVGPNSSPSNQRDHEDLMQMVANFKLMGFVPKSLAFPFSNVLNSQTNLGSTNMNSWPDNIVWVRKTPE